MTNALSTAPQLLRDYYRVLTGGAQAFGQGEELRPLLSEHLDFTGPLAGSRPDSTEGFLRGVAGFVATVGSVTYLQEVHDQHGSAVLYDAALPGGTVRFAEFFTLNGGRIAALHLHYNGPDYLAKGGR